jgi:hypothetical protein
MASAGSSQVDRHACGKERLGASCQLSLVVPGMQDGLLGRFPGLDQPLECPVNSMEGLLKVAC